MWKVSGVLWYSMVGWSQKEKGGMGKIAWGHLHWCGSSSSTLRIFADNWHVFREFFEMRPSRTSVKRNKGESMVVSSILATCEICAGVWFESGWQSDQA